MAQAVILGDMAAAGGVSRALSAMLQSRHTWALTSGKAKTLSSSSRYMSAICVDIDAGMLRS